MSDKTNRRVIEILDFLTSRPTDTFTLSEIALHLNISFGSAHRALTSLTQAGYLDRHPKHKTYSLGMVLISVGQAALTRHPVVEIAQREMQLLSSKLGVQTIANAVVGNEMLFIAKAGSSATAEGVTRVGQRKPFLPPLGLTHLAWLNPPEVDKYLAAFENILSGDQINHFKNALETIRQRGYSMSVQGKGLQEIVRQLALIDMGLEDSELQKLLNPAYTALVDQEIQIMDISTLKSQRLSHISAPVFNSEGSVVIEISLTGLPATICEEEISTIIEQLLATTTAITVENHGKIPDRVAI